MFAAMIQLLQNKPPIENYVWVLGL